MNEPVEPLDYEPKRPPKLRTPVQGIAVAISFPATLAVLYTGFATYAATYPGSSFVFIPWLVLFLLSLVVLVACIRIARG